MKSEPNPDLAKPWRAMENEVASLNRLFLAPLGFSQDSESMTKQFSGILLEACANTGTTSYYSGKGLFWYQMYEGIIHGLIIFGGLVHVLGFKGRLANLTVWLCYELGMVLELITYGPIYFWVISLMCFGAFFPSALSLTFVPSSAVQFLALGFMTHHHIGYVLDTWGSYQILRVWGCTPGFAEDTKPATKKKKSKKS